jgi:hypothetical protein
VTDNNKIGTAKTTGFRRSRKCVQLAAAAFDGVALGAPAQHPAGEIGDIGKTGLAQDHGGLRRAAAGAAHPTIGRSRASSSNSPSAILIALRMCSERALTQNEHHLNL